MCVAINALGGFGCLAMAAASVKLESCRLRSRQLEVRVAQLLVYVLLESAVVRTLAQLVSAATWQLQWFDL